MDRRRFLNSVQNSSSDIVYGNQIVAYYNVTEDDYDDEMGYYRIYNIETHYDYENNIISFVEDDFYSTSFSPESYFREPGIHKITFIFKDDCTDLSGIFSAVSNLIKLDFTNFNSAIITNFDSAFYITLNLTEIIGTINLDSSINCNCMFGVLPTTQIPHLIKLSCVNYGKQENMDEGKFIGLGSNLTPIIWQEVFVKGAFDRRSAGYADHFIGYFNDSSFMTEEEQAIVKAKGYTWDYD